MNKLSEIFKIADIHVTRMTSAICHIKHLFPLNAETIPNMEENELLWIELLVNRFGKLQDLLGAKLIDAFLEATAENIQQLTMLDKINKLERLGIIENAQLWKDIRSVRNHIAHEYPDHPELTAKYLNQIFELTPKLLGIVENLKNTPLNE